MGWCLGWGMGLLLPFGLVNTRTTKRRTQRTRMINRLWLPLLLGVTCFGAFVWSGRLGNASPPQASGQPVQHVSTPALSLRRVGEVIAVPAAEARLAEAIGATPNALSPLACAAVLVDGQMVFSVDAERALVPGYVQMLLTAVTAFDVLGPDHRFVTGVFAELPADENGYIDSSLYLIGGGDPVLMDRNYAMGFRPPLVTHTAFADVADAVIASGISQISGGIVGVERRYDLQRTLPGWPPPLVEAGVVGNLTALQVNDGLVDRPAATGGSAVPIEFPALDAAERLDDLLEDRGLVLPLSPRELREGEELPDLVPVGRVESASLSEIIFQMLAVNDAGAAEMLMKEIGIADSGDGSTRAGGQAVAERLSERGHPLKSRPRDGSGLDPVSTTSCEQMVRIVDGLDETDPVVEALPEFGLPGVFEGRFRGESSVEGLRLIGGVVGKASSLIGRTVGTDQRVSMVTIVNREGGPTPTDLLFQQRLVRALPAAIGAVSAADLAAPLNQ